MRIGHGYDVHRLVSGRALILGGVFISEKRPRKPRAAAPLPPVPSHLQERN